MKLSNPAESSASPQNDIRNAMACAIISLGCLLLAWPFGNSAFNDDWSYAFTVKKLIETGHLLYNGWATASLVVQAYWGALWVLLLGRTGLNLFDILRLSTMPLAGGAVALCYLIARRSGLAPAFSAFAALLLGLSPLFFPMAASFMTDVPGLFFVFLSLYALVRAAEAAEPKTAIAWLVFGALIGLIGGTGRQTVWIVPLSVLPYIAFLRWRNRGVALASIAGWIIIFSGALITIRWFNSQPYAIPEPSVLSDFAHALHELPHFFLSFWTIWLTTILLILPAGITCLREYQGRRGIVGMIVLIMIGVVLLIRRHYALEPWMDNTLDVRGIMGRNEMAGIRAVAQPWAVRVILSFCVFAVTAILTAPFLLGFAQWSGARDQIRQFFLEPPLRRVMLPAMTLFAAAYLALLLPRCARGMDYDRYVLPLMPCLAIPLLLRIQTAGKIRPPIYCWLLLGIYAFYAIASTQELQALARARAAATDRLEAAGIPRGSIAAGFEYDYWTQLQTSGYINDPRLLHPPRAYKKGLSPTPDVHPLYRVEHQPATDTMTTAFGSVDYTTYLPPFHRRVFIDQFRDPWWLDPARSAARHADK